MKIIDIIKEYWKRIAWGISALSVIVAGYNDVHLKVYDFYKGIIHEEEVVKPKLHKILPHADSISHYKVQFFNLASDVKTIEIKDRKIAFQAKQSMKVIYYYFMVYERVEDTHGCVYHLRRAPDDGSPEAISRRDYWKLVDDVLYLVETSAEGVYYNDVNEQRIQLPHKWEIDSND